MINVGEGAGVLDSWRAWWERERRRPTGGSPAARAFQIYRRRDVLWMLVARDLKRKYATSYLGYVWTLLEPALLITVYWTVFAHVARLGIKDYLLFLALGVLPFQWFRSSVNGGSGVLSGNSKLISSINLPREIYPLSLVLTKSVEFLFTLPIIAVVALAYGKTPDVLLVLFPVALLLELLLNLGLALLLSAWTTLFRDLERALTSILRLLFYLSPILYPTGRVPGIGRWFFELNPLVGIIEMYRASFFDNATLSAHVIAVSVVGALLAFIGGWYAFIRMEPNVLKEL
ncbi:MAG TPA: ABC transporter permease [Mycobacteriales bacterium]|nr:ABC transporter permease [Mycobacteriales bacterium]